MLTIHLVAVGEKMPSWVDQGFAEYQKRIRGRLSLKLIEVPAGKRGRNANIERVIADEDQRLQSAIPSRCHRIALDRGGRALSTLQIVERMEQWLQDGEQVALLVGGPEGLSKQMLDSVNETWSLSALTFAHPIVRVLLAEQLYRCYSVLEGLPYHR